MSSEVKVTNSSKVYISGRMATPALKVMVAISGMQKTDMFFENLSMIFVSAVVLPAQGPPVSTIFQSLGIGL